MLRELLNEKPSEARNKLCKLPLTEEEFVEITILDEKELMQLLFICGVKTYNDLPLIACTVNELRMAYSVWRAHEIDKRRKPYKVASRKIGKVLRLLKSYSEKGFFT